MTPPTEKRRLRAPPSSLPARMPARAFARSFQTLATRSWLGTPEPLTRQPIRGGSAAAPPRTMPLPDLHLCCAIHESCEQPQPLPPPHAAQQLHEAQKHFSAAHSHRHYVTRRELDDDTHAAASTRAPATSSSPMTHRCPRPPQLGLRAPCRNGPCV